LEEDIWIVILPMFRLRFTQLKSHERFCRSSLKSNFLKISIKVKNTSNNKMSKLHCFY
jgi:hypothetical protein